MRAFLHPLEIFLIACATLAAPLDAQGYPRSQRGSVSQHVAYTEIAVTYGRPTARGRALWGQLVPWDTVWHPGADSATRLTVDHDVVMEGHELKAGEYTLWLIPREHGTWTVILNRVAHTYHNRYPGAAQDALRFEATPDSLSFVETLTIDFPTVDGAETLVRIQWGAIGVPIHIMALYLPR